MDENKRLEDSLANGLRALDTIETSVPSIESMNMLVQQTKKKMRMELYLFLTIALLFTVCTVVFLVNSPGVYVMVQLLFILIVSVWGAIYFYRAKVSQHE
ncbi:DUF5345 family protein [Jeotgalibacillus campisalis]|uniref:Uncharacterized protein n=1 Tax=Jeotgalibacillus campisalis TaxID=220754 RepID=A0A0C2VWF2_9BACL|nr:DUF5345 family protein [Jeotgalibacillus campisalis]KIL53207.1 hypothetical protein KR50_05360 [Jeotgalibacillus campisalis]